MNIEDFNQSLKLFLDNEREKVLLVKGPWGIGKTYYIEQTLSRYEKDYNFIKVSLFGLGCVDDLSAMVSESILNKFISPTGNEIGKVIASIPLISKVLPKSLPSLDSFGVGSSFKKFVIFFDDAERMSLSIQELFGYIERIKNVSPFKMIVALNDAQVKGDEIWKLKEKVADKELRLSNTLEPVINSIYGEDSNFALRIFQGLNVANLRVVIKSFRVMNLFLAKGEQLNHENKIKLKVSCLCLSAKYYSSENFDDSNLGNISYFDAHFIFNSLVNSYLDSQFLNEKLFDIKLEHLISVQINNENNAKYEEIIDLLENTFEDNSEQIVKLSLSFLNRKDVDASKLRFIVNIIHKIGASIPTESIHFWFSNGQTKSQFFIVDMMDMFKSGAEFELVKRYLNVEKEEEVDNKAVEDEKNSLITAYLIQSNESQLDFYKDELSLFSKGEWLNYIGVMNPVSIFSRIQDELYCFILSEQGENLKLAIKDLAKTPIQEMRLIRIFGTRIEKEIK